MSRKILPDLLALSMLFISQIPAAAKERDIKLHGYITELRSPTEFQIDDYRITRDASLELQFERDRNDPKSPVNFLPTDLRVGTELEIRGLLEETGTLRATSIKVHLTDQKTIRRTALLDQSPSMSRNGGVWTGELYADGQKLVIQPSTKLTFVPNGIEKRAEKGARKANSKSHNSLQSRDKAEAPTPGSQSEIKGEADTEGELEPEPEGVPLDNANPITPDTWITFRGVRQLDGTILATSLQFKKNELERGEAKLRKDLTPKVKPLKDAGAELTIRGIGKYRLVPDDELQAYVRELGNKLIPEYQRSMPAGTPDKIDFQFFVVDSKVTNAFSLSNGTVIIYSKMFELLENEAQLASVIGHEISHAIEEHVYRQMQYHKWSLLALQVGGAVAASRGDYNVANAAKLIEAAVRNGYARSLEDQADRFGLSYMINAGYDPREAPRVWKVLTLAEGDRPSNFFWSNHNSNTLRRSYLMAELKNNYSGLDYARFQKRDERFAAIASRVKSRRVAGKKIRVH
jgi:Peptidase family M48/Domain of unknown function (DUF5666)